MGYRWECSSLFKIVSSVQRSDIVHTAHLYVTKCSSIREAIDFKSTTPVSKQLWDFNQSDKFSCVIALFDQLWNFMIHFFPPQLISPLSPVLPSEAEISIYEWIVGMQACGYPVVETWYLSKQTKSYCCLKLNRSVEVATSVFYSGIQCWLNAKPKWFQDHGIQCNDLFFFRMSNESGDWRWSRSRSTTWILWTEKKAERYWQ